MEDLDKCIQSLQKVSGKPNKFNGLKAKLQGRFVIEFTIDIGQINDIKMGFDNHLNHQRPHIHADIKKYNIGKISISIDDGKILHKVNKKIKSTTQNELEKWVLDRKDCLRFIYQHIKDLKNEADFDPLIDAMNKYM